MRVVRKVEWLRFKLMRLVACWLILAACCIGRGDKPLPPRLSRFVCALIAKAEQAAGLMLWLSVCTLLPARNRLCYAQRRAFCLAGFGAHFTSRTVTIPALRARLLALQHFLRNLAQLACQLAGEACRNASSATLAPSLSDCWLIVLPRFSAPRAALPFLPP